MQHRGLGPADQTSTKDDCEIRIGKAVLRRLSLRLDGEPSLLEKAAQIGLARGQEQDFSAVSVRR